MIAVDDLRGYLEGAWRVERTILDRRVGATGSFTGQALFSPSPEGLHYHESGVLALPGYEDTAERSYLYVFEDSRHCRVLFADGRPFHTLDLSRGRDKRMHCCRDDRYDGTFEAADAGTLLATWRVTGPRKNLRIESRLVRDLGTPPDS